MFKIHASCLMIALSFLFTTSYAADNETSSTVWLDELDLGRIQHSAHYLAPKCHSTNFKSVGGKREYYPMSLGGQKFERGVGTHARSELFIDLKKQATRFEAKAGLDDSVATRGLVRFEVWVDDVLATRSQDIAGAGSCIPVDIDVTNAARLALIVDPLGEHYANSHFDWADAKLTLKEQATTVPQTMALDPGTTPSLPLDDGPFPQFHGPRVTGVSPGKPLVFRIPVTGERPMKFVADNLPGGLSLNSETGVLSGTVKRQGTYIIKIKAENAKGAAKRELALVVSPNAIALTPPMGWNSWNCFHWNISDKIMRQTADLLEQYGLADKGYQYVVIDDVWQKEKERTTGALLLSAGKFPDMKALGDYIHSKGLKFGIYTSPGPQTCACFAGSYGYEKMDVDLFASWGVDYVKSDWCYYSKIIKEINREELMKPYKIMSEFMKESPRDMVFSLCQYGMGNVWEWGPEAGANLWRTSGDIIDTWGCMSTIGFMSAGKAKWAGPGHWNDPDMLTVGWVSCTRPLHASLLTADEQITHISLWSLLAAPLMIGCDLSKMDDFTRALLTNTEMIDINQDVLGKQGDRLKRDGFTEVWSKPLSDGTVAVGLFNRDIKSRDVNVKWDELGMGKTSRQPVRNVWMLKDMGMMQGGISETIPPHGCMLLRIGHSHEIPLSDLLKKAGIR